MKLTKKMLNKNLCVTDGNMKLVENDKEFFLIWSIPAIKTCPNATEMCKNACYAMKAERIYPNVRTSRKSNLLESMKENFVDDITQIIQWQKSRPSKKGKKIYFRIHESGDFYSDSYLKKWIEIANKNQDITFTAYTKSIKLIEKNFNEIPSNLVIRYSVWDDTEKQDLQLAKSLELPIYTAFEPKKLENKIATENYTECKCDCTVCKMCYNPKIKNIAVAIH